MKRSSGALLLALAVMFISQGPASSQEADAAIVIDGVVLFPDASRALVDGAQLSPALSEQVASSDHVRFVDVDVDVVRRELEFGVIKIQIAPDVVIDVKTVFGEELVQGATTWTAEGTDGAALALVTKGQAVTGEVRLAGRQWGIAQVDESLHVIFEHSPVAEVPEARRAPTPVAPEPVLSPLPPGVARFTEDLVHTEDVFARAQAKPESPAALLPGQVQAGDAPVAAMLATTVIDVMVVYDDTALAFHGSNAAIENLIIANVASSNAGFAASAIDASLNLVHVGHVAYAGSGSSFNDLTRLRNKYDGYMDDVHITRDAVAADLVTLVSELVDGFCGRANLLQDLPSQNTDDEAFGVVGAGCLTNNTYLHELGHNMGAAHDDANIGGLSGVHPYSRGWVDVTNNFVTVMSYSNAANGCSGCTTINQFSSSTELFNGFATGDANHQNAATLDLTRIGISDYRPDPCPNPANDDFPVRVDLGGSSLVSAAGTNTCASIEDLETYFLGDEPVESVWYEWTAPFAGTARFSTCDAATTFDTTITVFDDAAFFSALSVVGYNDDAGAACGIDPTHSEVLTTVTAGQVLRFKVDGDAAANGSFVLSVTIETTCNGQTPTVYLDRGDVPTAGDDVIIGTLLNDAINGLDGNDTICGLGGNDIINAGPGDDHVFAGDGDDTVFGVAGNDHLHGGAGQDMLLGFDGLDTLNGGPDADTLNGGAHADVINGDEGNDAIYGQDGNDEISGGAGDDAINGSGGVDTIHGDAGNDTINGGPDDDTVHGGDDDDTIFGITGNDILNGDGGADQIFGQIGIDTIDGGPGADNIWGNEDDDIITDPSGMNIINGGPGNDHVTGGLDSDVIFGDGNLAQAGDDTLDGGLGADQLNGFAGDDILIANDGIADIIINGGPNGPTGDTCTVDAGIDLVFNCEN